MTCPEFDPCKFTRIKYSPDGKYIAASMEGAADGHFDYLFVWEAASGKLLKNWHQDNAFMADGSSEHRDYSIPVNDFLFLPDNKSIVYASGNTLITRNIRGNDTQDVLKLGTFYASEISGSADGRLVYTLMNWYKDHGWVGEETKQQKLQIWNIHTHAMLKEMKFPEGYDLNLKLVGPALVQIDTIKATAQITNLVKDQSEEMPFQTGDYNFNSDGKLGIIIFSDIYNQNQIIMHLWNMEKSRILYDIIPDLGEKWFINLGSIVFSPDNRTLAFCHQSQVTLWNIGPELDKSE